MTCWHRLRFGLSSVVLLKPGKLKKSWAEDSITVLATLEVNPDARPVVLYKNRNNMTVLEIGYTHVRLSFVVTIRKSANCPLIQYQSSDGNAPTVAVEHTFPATEERRTAAGNNTVFGTIGVSGQQNDRI